MTEKEYQKKYREEHKEYFKNYYLKNKERISQMNKERRLNNYEYYLKKERENYLKNKEKNNECSRNYKKNNRSKINEYERNRKLNDPIFNLKVRIRKTLRKSFNRKGMQKETSTEEILGCNIEDFVKYLYKTFKDNYGYEWDKKEPVHIDHIIPLSTAATEDEVKKLCYYTNLQLLKAKDNLEKSCKLNWQL